MRAGLVDPSRPALIPAALANRRAAFYPPVMAKLPTRPNALQCLWMAGMVAMIAATLADLAGWLDIPSLYWVLGFAVLLLFGRKVMPAREEARKDGGVRRR